MYQASSTNMLMQGEMERTHRVNPVVNTETRVVLDQILLRNPAEQGISGSACSIDGLKAKGGSNLSKRRKAAQQHCNVSTQHLGTRSLSRTVCVPQS